MSSIAKYFLNKGNEIIGYDRLESEIIKNLSKQGVKVLDNPDINLIPDNFKSNDVIVIYSSAISKENSYLNYYLTNKNKIYKDLKY